MAISLLQQPLDRRTTSPFNDHPRHLDPDRDCTLPKLSQDIISRPSSSTPSTATNSSTIPRQNSVQLPGLAALASIASGQPPVENMRTPPPPSYQNDNSSLTMSYATAAPGQSAGSTGSAPPICYNCETSTTPLWRRDESGAVLCNACGLFHKLHGRPRPISLKTNVIKSRNRVKATGPAGGQKRKLPMPGPGLAAAYPEVSSTSPSAYQTQHALSDPNNAHRQSLSRGTSPSINVYPPPASDSQSDHYQSPTSHHHGTSSTANIAPQHMFDGTTYESNSITQPLRRHSTDPTMGSHRSTPDHFLGSRYHHGSNRLGDDSVGLVNENNRLKTRVSELEVVNDLFKERVNELEKSEMETRRTMDDLKAALSSFQSRQNGSRHDEPAGLHAAGDESPRKRLRSANMI
ncbi:MAG: hypothetical protein M1831_003165 [Alyxoria varia]|nr:MAG: hypothetical protein M1831_003165 [Alyxoria varia]